MSLFPLEEYLLRSQLTGNTWNARKKAGTKFLPVQRSIRDSAMLAVQAEIEQIDHLERILISQAYKQLDRQALRTPFLCSTQSSILLELITS